jgi:phage tail sheath protein FI
MPEYLAPGVYVEEISSGPKPIEGISTSVAGFLGPTERGPEDIQYITSFLAFQRMYGKHLPVNQSYMVHAVQGFFDNGGQRCFIGRITGTGAAFATLQLGNFIAVAVGRGAWGNRVFVKVKPSSQATQGSAKAAAWVRIQVMYYRTVPAQIIDPFDRNQLQNPARVSPDVLEDFDDLSPQPGDANFLVTAINGASQLIAILPPDPLVPGQGITPGDFQPLQGGDDGNTTLAQPDYVGDLNPLFPNDPNHILGLGHGMTAMNSVEEVSLLVLPDQAGNSDLTALVVSTCELLHDRFGVLSVARGFQVTGKPDLDTNYAGQYYPWIWVYDPVVRDDVMIPPAGHVTGIIARTDLDQGVHKAPANAVVAGAKRMQKPVLRDDQALLNPVGINCIRDFTADGRGIRLWGARTMTSDPEWKYINVRRLFLFIEGSIYRGTQWVVFEPNSDPTWARVARTVTSFLNTVWRSGALLGTTQDQAFFVKCDRTTMTPDDIDNGRLICVIGIAPVKPAEFVIFRIGQKTADAPS